jgi:hypothetical protein
VGKKPKGPPGRALTDESQLDDDELDRVIGGVASSTEGQDENDGWSRIVDDHFEEVPAKPPAAGPRRERNDEDKV